MFNNSCFGSFLLFAVCLFICVVQCTCSNIDCESEEGCPPGYFCAKTHVYSSRFLKSQDSTYEVVASCYECPKIFKKDSTFEFEVSANLNGAYDTKTEGLFYPNANTVPASSSELNSQLVDHPWLLLPVIVRYVGRPVINSANAPSIANQDCKTGIEVKLGESTSLNFTDLFPLIINGTSLKEIHLNDRFCLTILPTMPFVECSYFYEVIESNESCKTIICPSFKFTKENQSINYVFSADRFFWNKSHFKLELRFDNELLEEVDIYAGNSKGSFKSVKNPGNYSLQYSKVEFGFADKQINDAFSKVMTDCFCEKDGTGKLLETIRVTSKDFE